MVATMGVCVPVDFATLLVDWLIDNGVFFSVVLAALANTQLSSGTIDQRSYKSPPSGGGCTI